MTGAHMRHINYGCAFLFKLPLLLPLKTCLHLFTRHQESGMVHMGDLALQYNLGTELLATAVTRRVGTVIRGRVDGGLLYTPAYIRR